MIGTGECSKLFHGTVGDRAASCDGDSCKITSEERREMEEMLRGLSDEAKAKLLDWMGYMEPMDYDAPGSTVREQGV